MKKILQLFTAVSCMFTAVESNGQVAPGSRSPDWTLTDIDGVSHNLYTYLNEGKTVFIDISATWCAPCWDYHNTGALEDLWVNHGPAGGNNVSPSTTDDVMVFWVEGDSTTFSADLHGTGPNTQGDWTAGVSHPIIDPTPSTTPSTNAFNRIYHVSYFPACIMICPNRTMTEVDQYTAVQFYNAKSSCWVATDADDAEMITSTSLNILISCDSVTPTFRLGNIGTSNLTSATITYKVNGVVQKTFNWTGNVVKYDNTIITGIKVGSSVSGNHTITAEVSNPNGNPDPTTGNNSTDVPFTIYPAIGGGLVTESFESAGIPNTFLVLPDADGKFWDNATVGYNSSASATLNWYSIAPGNIELMTLPPISFAMGTGQSLTFDVAYCQYSSENDKLEVQVSTNCGTTWKSEYSKSGATLSTHAALNTSFTPATSADWRHETVSLSSYAGNPMVLIRFKGTSAYGNNLFVDNIVVTSVGMVITTTVTNAICGLNDGAIQLSISGGTSPFSFSWSNGSLTKDLADLTAGTFTVSVTDNDGNVTTKSVTVSTTPPVITATVTNASCGLNNGALAVVITGSASPFTYSWSNGAITETLADLGAGTFTVTITGSDGCTATKSVSVSKTQNPSVSLKTLTHTSVAGASDGKIDITVMGGVQPYTYQWTNGQFTQDLDSLIAGIYTVTVTDSRGCTITSQYTLSDLVSVSVKSLKLSGYNTHYKVSPNPVKDNISISFGNNNEKRIYIEIFSLTGKKIFSEILVSDAQEGVAEVKCNLPDGAYLYKITSLSSQESGVLSWGKLVKL